MTRKIKTSLGYKAEIDAEKAIDFELTYLMGALQNDEPVQAMTDVAAIIDKLLGSREKVTEFFAVIRKKTGTVSQEVVMGQIQEIITQLTTAEETKK